MSLKRTLAKSAALLVTTLGFAFSPANAANFRLSHSADTEHPNHIAAVEMVKRIAERTKGEINIKIFPNSTLGTPPETAEQVRLGVLEFCILAPSQLDKYDRAFGVLGIPYDFDSLAHAHKTLDVTAAKWMKELHEKIGLTHIANFEWGFRIILNSVRPVNSPEDMKGLKIRVPPELQIKAAIDSMGGVSTLVAFPEVYLALANGTVDGQDNPVSTVWSQKYYETSKHLALTNHVYTTMMFVANSKKFAQLTPEQRQIIQEEGLRAGQMARQIAQEKEKWFISEMEKKGLKTTYPDIAKFRPLMGPATKATRDYVNNDAVWEQWAKFVKDAR